ncbi:hypothetical protein HERIO_1769 [Hepatospora eriocheir]|uniref:Uncharacterized protein n=1 Tax=Hepatospora eriocheir TaxID=1081669 RepID=A0A1X0Q940_9MICR|nr:hypothetical protein HERIO_1769 [Hepatospora eriocheir]
MEPLKKSKELTDGNVIKRSTSNIVPSCFLILKKDRDLRFIVDYQRLNSNTIKSLYPILRLFDQIYSLKGLYFSLK